MRLSGTRSAIRLAVSCPRMSDTVCCWQGGLKASGCGSVGTLAGARVATATPALTCRRAAVHPLGSRTPVGEQNTRQERVYCIPIGCSERTNKENHAEVAPPPPAKNRPSAVRTSPSTRTPPSPARALPHRAPPHRTRRTQRRQQQPGPTCPARARVVVGRTARQSPPSHAPHPPPTRRPAPGLVTSRRAPPCRARSCARPSRRRPRPRHP